MFLPVTLQLMRLDSIKRNNVMTDKHVQVGLSTQSDLDTTITWTLEKISRYIDGF